MTFRHPFQKLCIVPAFQRQHRLLLAASGPTINSIDIDEGKLLHQWPLQNAFDSEDENPTENGDRPSKRRKLGLTEHGPLSRQASEASDASIEIVAERKKGERKKTKIIDNKLPNVSHILVTSDGKHAVAVTGEDKAVRVFEITSLGKLRQLSQRLMPKKLCAIRLTKDESTILAADKFGDVYALPFYPSKDWIPRQKPSEKGLFKPSATELTVHSKSNLEALRQQREAKSVHPRKEGPQFEYQVLLGHVSLLTDLLAAEGMVEGRSRPYIITADRDEHIRVSRGIPQTHIIECFCLGHKEFVSRLCIPPATPELLLAGSGEASISVHHWQTGKLKDTLTLWPCTHTLMDEEDKKRDFESRELPEGRTSEKLVISGIWPIEFSRTVNPNGEEQSIVLVSIEGLPLLVSCVLTPTGLYYGQQTIKLVGNVLDLVSLDDQNQILVSIDSVHRPCSMKSYRSQSEQGPAHLQIIKLEFDENGVNNAGKFVWSEVEQPAGFTNIFDALPEAPPRPQENETISKGYEKVFSPLGELLYGLENLRKKRGVAAAEEEAAEEAEEVEPPEMPTDT